MFNNPAKVEQSLETIDNNRETNDRTFMKKQIIIQILNTNRKCIRGTKRVYIKLHASTSQILFYKIYRSKRAIFIVEMIYLEKKEKSSESLFALCRYRLPRY